MTLDEYSPSRLSYMARRRAAAMAGFARGLRSRPGSDPFWCERCETSHRDPIVVAECQRLLEASADRFTQAA
jgi:hypothetical protein